MTLQLKIKQHSSYGSFVSVVYIDRASIISIIKAKSAQIRPESRIQNMVSISRGEIDSRLFALLYYSLTSLA